MLERQYCCSRLEVRVVVRHSEVIRGGESRGQQIRHSRGPVLALPREFSLRAQSGQCPLDVGNAADGDDDDRDRPLRECLIVACWRSFGCAQ